MPNATQRWWPVFSLLLACERSAELAETANRSSPNLGAAPSAASAPAQVMGATPTAVPLGQAAQTPFFRIRVHERGPCRVEDHLKPANGLERVGVEVTLEATADQAVPANPFYATLETQAGRRYESTLSGCRPVLQAEQLRPGQSTRGWLSFDVPESEEPVYLRYQPLVLGAGRQKALLSLQP